MLKIHPFVEIEDGDMIPLEKSRRPERAIDRLVEFASEFSRINKLVIFLGQEAPDEEAMDLKDRLLQIAPGLDIPFIVYDPIIASHIGPEAWD